MKTTPKTGNKTLTVTVRFFTNGCIAAPKHAMDKGYVTVDPNARHGIKSGYRKNFNTSAGILPALEAALTQAGVKMHHGLTSSRLWEPKTNR